MNRHNIAISATFAFLISLAIIPSCAPREMEKSSFDVSGYQCVIQTIPGHRLNPAQISGVENYLKANVKLADPDTGDVLGRLNVSEIGELVPAGDIFTPLSDLIEYSNKSYGAFDPTLQILWDVYDFNHGGRRVSDGELTDALRWVDYKKVEIYRDSILRTGENTRVGFGPVLSGAMTDWMVESLKQSGSIAAIINAGTSIAYLGELPDKNLIYQIRYPLEKFTDDVVQLNVGSIKIESGEYVSALDDNIKFFFAGGEPHHMVIEPRFGKPVRGVKAAVVVSRESALQASVFAYALMVMGLERGLEFMDEVADQNVIGGIIMTDDHQVHVSGGLAERFWR